MRAGSPCGQPAHVRGTAFGKEFRPVAQHNSVSQLATTSCARVQ